MDGAAPKGFSMAEIMALPPDGIPMRDRIVVVQHPDGMATFLDDGKKPELLPLEFALAKARASWKQAFLTRNTLIPPQH